MNLAVFIVEKQEVDSHLQVGNFVCDVRAFSSLLHFQFYAIIETYFLIIDNSEFLTLLLYIEFCSI